MALRTKGPTLVCESCGGLTWATLAGSCWICVAEDEDIKAAKRALAKIETTIERARLQRRDDGGPISEIDRAGLTNIEGDGSDRQRETP